MFKENVSQVQIDNLISVIIDVIDEREKVYFTNFVKTNPDVRDIFEYIVTSGEVDEDDEDDEEEDCQCDDCLGIREDEEDELEADDFCDGCECEHCSPE